MRRENEKRINKNKKMNEDKRMSEAMSANENSRILKNINSKDICEIFKVC